MITHRQETKRKNKRKKHHPSFSSSNTMLWATDRPSIKAANGATPSSFLSLAPISWQVKLKPKSRSEFRSLPRAH